MESTILEFPFFFWAMLAAIVIVVANMIGLTRRAVQCTRRFDHIPGVTARGKPIVALCVVGVAAMGAAAAGLLTFRSHLHERNQQRCQEMLSDELVQLEGTTRWATSLSARGGAGSREDMASGTILCLMTNERGELDVEWSRRISTALSEGDASSRFARFPSADECECKYRLWRKHPEQLIDTGCRFLLVITPREIEKQAYSTKVYIAKIPGTIFQKRESMRGEGGTVTVSRYRYQATLMGAESGAMVAAGSFTDRPFPEVLYNMKGPGGGVQATLAWAVGLVSE